MSADEGNLEEATAVGCAALVDAMGRRCDHRAHILSLTSPTPDRPMFGRAATIDFLPYRQDRVARGGLGFAGLFYQAVGAAAAGKILVMSSGGYPDASHGDGTKLSRVANNGLQGVLCDGRLRDFDELSAHGFATWCAGEATRWGGDTITPSAANVPVAVGGVQIIPGDYIYADRTGCVVIPEEHLRSVLADAARTVADEHAALETIRAEDPAALVSGSHRETER